MSRKKDMRCPIKNRYEVVKDIVCPMDKHKRYAKVVEDMFNLGHDVSLENGCVVWNSDMFFWFEDVRCPMKRHEVLV